MSRKKPVGSLAEVRAEITSKGRSEQASVRDNEGLSLLLDEIQCLKIEMNDAKKKAAEAAAAPYLQRIHELEAEYAFLLKLSA